MWSLHANGNTSLTGSHKKWLFLSMTLKSVSSVTTNPVVWPRSLNVRKSMQVIPGSRRHWLQEWCSQNNDSMNTSWDAFIEHQSLGHFSWTKVFIVWTCESVPLFSISEIWWPVVLEKSWKAQANTYTCKVQASQVSAQWQKWHCKNSHKAVAFPPFHEARNEL